MVVAISYQIKRGPKFVAEMDEPISRAATTKFTEKKRKDQLTVLIPCIQSNIAATERHGTSLASMAQPIPCLSVAAMLD